MRCAAARGASQDAAGHVAWPCRADATNVDVADISASSSCFAARTLAEVPLSHGDAGSARGSDWAIGRSKVMVVGVLFQGAPLSPTPLRTHLQPAHLLPSPPPNSIAAKRQNAYILKGCIFSRFSGFPVNVFVILFICSTNMCLLVLESLFRQICSDKHKIAFVIEGSFVR